MATREIPKSEWRQELDQFSREHEGTPAKLQIRGGSDSREEARELPFQGVSVDAPNSSSVAISLGASADDHITHEVRDAVSVAIDDADRPGGRLEVKGADGTTATVEFSDSRRSSVGSRQP